MPRKATKDQDQPALQLTMKQINELYLQIQANIGILESTKPPEPIKIMLRDISIDLLRTKRKWIGDYDSLSGQI